MRTATDRDAVTTAEAPEGVRSTGVGDPAGRVVLGRYRLGERLGGGGMGVVWRAVDMKLGREVAVKQVPCADHDSARRADREARAAARLQHPAIVALYESVAEDDQVWLVSELVRGTTLDGALNRGLLSDRDVVEIGIELCDALAHAHRQGVVHRDVKPKNILVPDPDHGGGAAAKLTDFGIARLAGDDAVTRTGDIVGTLAYMAPEQADGSGAGPESDLYSLGLCIYEALSGVNPVRGRGMGATARRVGLRLPPLGRLRRDLDLDLCVGVDRAVDPDPHEGGTLADLKRALRAARGDLDDEPGTIAGAAVEALAGAPDVTTYAAGPGTRLLAAAMAAAIAASSPLLLGSQVAGIEPLTAAAIAAVAVAVLPRLGWVVAAAVVIVALAGERPALALLATLAAVPVPLVLRRAEPWSWSLGAGAVTLGLAGVAIAAPALAIRVKAPLHRVAVGIFCAWWAVVAQVASGRGLVPGLEHGAPVTVQLHDNTLAALVSSPALMFAALCAVGALVGPWMTAARSVALTVVGALIWALALSIALAALVERSPLEIVSGTAVAAALAVMLRPSRPSPETVPLP